MKINFQKMSEAIEFPPELKAKLDKLTADVTERVTKMDGVSATIELMSMAMTLGKRSDMGPIGKLYLTAFLYDLGDKIMDKLEAEFDSKNEKKPLISKPNLPIPDPLTEHDSNGEA